MSLFNELKRRNVFRVAAAYLAASWLVIEVVQTLFPIFGLSESAIRLIVLLAKILYAEHEDAPEVEMGATAHYDIVFNQMLSVETPESEWQRMENSDQLLQVETSGSTLNRGGGW